MQLLSSFRAIRIGLMVGIGGGVPSSNADIRLGDIVVSQPSDTFGGVIQYDLGKALSGGKFKRTGMLNRPPKTLLTALATLQAYHLTEDSQVIGFISNMQAKLPPHKAKQFARPTKEDCLFWAEYNHIACDTTIVHYGLIGSANQVVKDGKQRDQLAQDLGIYGYAAAAAAYAKELLLVVPIDHIDTAKTSSRVPEAVIHDIPISTSSTELVDVAREKATVTQQEQELECKYETGYWLYADGRYREAEDILRETLLEQEKALGHSHEETLVSAYWLGHSLFDQFRCKEAETLLRRALPGPDVLGFDHKSRRDCEFWLGRSLYRQDRYKNAEDMFRRTLLGREKVLGHNDKDTLLSAHWLGISLYHQDRHKNAEDMFRRALQGRENMLGHDHKETLESAFWLGHSLCDQDQYEEAEFMFRRTLQGREQVLGSNNKDTLLFKHWLGVSLCRPDRYEDAETILRRTIRGRERVLGHNHEDTLLSVHWLGVSLYRQNRYQEAEPIFRQAVQGRENVLGHDHVETSRSRKYADQAHERALGSK
ncbi:hypothetical protein HAV15_008620 [Penicillium sp. str. |nr:hypothetical protein HAV15_008620 [Penicillium sp. str. \